MYVVYFVESFLFNLKTFYEIEINYLEFTHFLSKNAEPSEFQEIIEQFSAEVELK